MTASDRAERPLPRLRCLGGDVAPGHVIQDAARGSKFSTPALEDLWRVLEPSVLGPMTVALERELSAYCRHFEIAEADLGHVMRITRFLLQRAAAIDLTAEHFAEDLATVWPGATALRERLLQHYGAIKLRLRESLLADALMKHGNVLTGVEWRVDRVLGESDAPRLDLPLALITLSYRQRDRTESITLQMTPNQLMRTAQVLEALASQVRLLMPRAATNDQAPQGEDKSAPQGE